MSEPRALTDGDAVKVTAWLQRNAGMANINISVVHTAISAVARDYSFHPVREYLRSVTWDGVSRLRGMLHAYFGAEDNEYHASVGAMFMIGMVARVMRPGCKMDYMPVLEGRMQGEGKSTACRILAGKYFSDSLPDMHSKDASQHLRCKWLLEISELDAVRKSDINTQKQFLTRQEERYRPAYGREQVVEPRQCVFIGTSNDDEYLRDETGGRRFWPVRCGKLDLEALKRDRNVLFGEALQLFAAGAPWWPDREFERTAIAPVQRQRYDEDAWQGAIEDYLLTIEGTDIMGVAKHALNMVGSYNLTLGDSKQIARILKVLGWEKAHTRSGNVWRRVNHVNHR